MPILKRRHTLHKSTDFTVIQCSIHVDHQCCTEVSGANTAVKFGLVGSTAWKKASLTSQGFLTGFFADFLLGDLDPISTILGELQSQIPLQAPMFKVK